MILDLKTAMHLHRLIYKLEAGTVENPMIQDCPECDRTLTFYDADVTGHAVWAKGWADPDNGGINREEYTLLIGCEGYWIFDPNTHQPKND